MILFLFQSFGINKCWIMCTVERWRCRFLIDIENGSEAHPALVWTVSLYHPGTICRLKQWRGNFPIHVWHPKKGGVGKVGGCRRTWQQKDGNKRILQLYFSRDDTAESGQTERRWSTPCIFLNICVFSPLMCSINKGTSLYVTNMSPTFLFSLF